MSREANRRLLAVIVFALLVAAPAFAQTTRPTTLESQTFVRTTRPASATPGDNGIHWQRLVIAMAVVLGLIVLLRYAAGWLMPHTRAGGNGRAVRVLSRTAIAPRQQVLLLHVGRRVLVVGDSAGTLSSLAAIDEPDEVAELLGQASASPVSPNKFRSLFGRAEADYDDPNTMAAADAPDAAEPTDPALIAAKDDIAGLLDRMRSLTKNSGR